MRWSLSRIGWRGVLLACCSLAPLLRTAHGQITNVVNGPSLGSTTCTLTSTTLTRVAPSAALKIIWAVHGPDPTQPGPLGGGSSNRTIPYIIPEDEWHTIAEPTGWSTFGPTDSIGYQGFLLYHALLSARTASAQTGGRPAINLTTGMLPINLTIWNIGSVRSPLSLARAKKVVTTIAGLKNISSATFLFAPPFSRPDINMLFMSLCETTRTCMALHIINPPQQMLTCLAPLPPDCVALGRQVGDPRFLYSLSALPDQTTVFSSAISILKAKGASTVAILAQGNDIVSWAVPVMREEIEAQRMTVPFMLQLETTGLVANTTSMAQVAARLVALDVDAIIWHVLPNTNDLAVSTFAQIYCALWDSGYMPRAHVLYSGGDDLLRTQLIAMGCDRASLVYAISTLPFIYLFRGASFRAKNMTGSVELFPANQTSDSPAVFLDTFRQHYPGTVPGSVDRAAVWAAFAAASYNIVHRLVEWADTDHVPSLRTAASMMSIPSFWGAITFDRFGRIIRPDTAILQRMQPVTISSANQSNYYFPFSVLSPIIVGEEAVYPLPTVAERSFHPQFYREDSERALVACAAIVLAYFIALTAWLVAYWSHPAVRTATPLFLLFLVVGGALMAASVPFSTLHVNSEHCRASVWLLTLGFTLCYSSLLFKTYRVCAIYEAKTPLLLTRPLRTRTLVGGVIALLAVDFVLNLAWEFATSGMVSQTIVVDVDRPSFNYTQCSYGGDRGTVFLALHLAIKSGLMLASLRLAYRTRRVPTRFNESGWLTLSVYNCCLLVALFVPLLHAAIEQDSHMTAFQVRGYGVLLMAASTVSLLLIPKVTQVETERRQLALAKELANKKGIVGLPTVAAAAEAADAAAAAAAAAAGTAKTNTPGGHTPRGTLAAGGGKPESGGTGMLRASDITLVPATPINKGRVLTRSTPTTATVFLGLPAVPQPYMVDDRDDLAYRMQSGSTNPLSELDRSGGFGVHPWPRPPPPQVGDSEVQEATGDSVLGRGFMQPGFAGQSELRNEPPHQQYHQQGRAYLAHHPCPSEDVNTPHPSTFGEARLRPPPQVPTSLAPSVQSTSPLSYTRNLSVVDHSLLLAPNPSTVSPPPTITHDPLATSVVRLHLATPVDALADHDHDQ